MPTQDAFENREQSDEAEEFLRMNEQELVQLLVQRVDAIQKNVDLNLRSSFEVDTSPLEKRNLPPWIEKTVDAMVKTALGQTHSVVCSSEVAYAGLRTQLLAALGVGGTAAVLALSSFLISTLGFATALATVVATIVIKRIGEPAIKAGHRAMCDELKKKVDLLR